MARYTGAVCKLCRREGMKLFIKGERCLSPKCAIERRNQPPGMHGKKVQFQRKRSDFGVQLREKQKARRIYGVYEQQFRRYFGDALRIKGRTGAALLITLERRMDNVVYRLGLADSRSQARQFVLHGHFTLNGGRATIPSQLVKTGDVVNLREGSRRSPVFKEIAERLGEKPVPEWLALDIDNQAGRVQSIPSREQIDTSVNEQLIVEFYSR